MSTFCCDNLIVVTDTSFNGGAKGDGTTDDTTAIQDAINSATKPSTVLFPPGNYKITSALTIPNTYVLCLVGHGMYTSRISCATSMTAMLNTSSAIDTLRIQDLGLLCANLAASGFKCENITHSTLLRVLVINSTGSALRLNNGYTNTIEGCILTSCVNGVDSTGENVNALSIVNNQIYGNSGIGVLVANGQNINIIRNDIETNQIAGVVAYDAHALNIQDNYFERNGTTGYSFTTPETLSVKSDIFLFSGAKVLEAVTGQDVECCRITGNSFTPDSGRISSSIFATAANNLRVENNQVLNSTNQTYMLGVWNNSGAAYLRNPITASQNTDNRIGFLGTGSASYLITTPNNYLAANAPTSLTWNHGDRVFNSAPAVGSAKSWVCTVAGTPGTWVSEGNL